MSRKLLVFSIQIILGFDYCILALYIYLNYDNDLNQYIQNYLFLTKDENMIIHGLETLIELYQEDAKGLVTKLVTPVKKDPPPHDSRRHGRTNLLHRATKEGNGNVILQIFEVFLVLFLLIHFINDHKV